MYFVFVILFFKLNQQVVYVRKLSKNSFLKEQQIRVQVQEKCAVKRISKLYIFSLFKKEALHIKYDFKFGF